jgi:MmyB-like transcription regulator ligand binding domain
MGSMEFGDFLRARRARVTPDQVGLPTTGRRRVSGLRREEVRQLMDGWPKNPTLPLGRTYDVLARNRLGAALWRPFTYSDNLLLNIFLDDAAPSFLQRLAGGGRQHGGRIPRCRRRRARRSARQGHPRRVACCEPGVRRDLGTQRRPRLERGRQDLHPSRRR